MSQITAHILDTARGSPARNVAVILYRQMDGESRQMDGESSDNWVEVGRGRTNEDGRIPGLCAQGQALAAGVYRMHFATRAYFQSIGSRGFYPWADIVFQVQGDGQHYHIPLLLSPYGYSTYRGS